MQKSAAAIARIACDTGAPSTIGRSTRYQIAPGPGTPKWPRAARSDIPVTKGLEEKIDALDARLIRPRQFDRLDRSLRRQFVGLHLDLQHGRADHDDATGQEA